MKKLLTMAGFGLAMMTMACNKAPVDEGSVHIWDRYATAQGDTLYVSWLKVDGADAYVVYDNSTGTLTAIDTLEGDTILSYHFGTACTQVGVSTMIDGELGDVSTVDLTLSAPDTALLFSRDDTTSDHYEYFNVDMGTGQISLVDSAHRNQSYGFLKGPADTITMHSSYILYGSDKGVRLWLDTSATSLEEMEYAPAPTDPGWSPAEYDSAGVDLATGDLFYFWVDECLVGAPGWSNLDLFGKVEIMSVAGYTVTGRFKFQTGIRALRWLVE